MLSIVLSLAFVLSLSANHRSGSSKLELRLWDNSFFSVEIDYKKYPSLVSKFTISNLAPGKHFIKVIRKIQRPNGYHASVVFQGYVDIPARSRITAKITHKRRFEIIKIRPLKPTHPTRRGHNSHHGSHTHGYNAHSSVGVNTHHSTAACQAIPVMTESTFYQLKASMDFVSFDSKRLEIAKQALAFSMVSSEQVLELLNLLTFDCNRLELAKFAFERTYDKQNYFIVNNAFTFSSNISALNQYINTYSM